MAIKDTHRHLCLDDRKAELHRWTMYGQESRAEPDLLCRILYCLHIQQCHSTQRSTCCSWCSSSHLPRRTRTAVCSTCTFQDTAHAMDAASHLRCKSDIDLDTSCRHLCSFCSRQTWCIYPAVRCRSAQGSHVAESFFRSTGSRSGAECKSHHWVAWLRRRHFRRSCCRSRMRRSCLVRRPCSWRYILLHPCRTV